MSVFAIASNITSETGFDVAAHWSAAKRKQSGISEYMDASLSDNPFWGSKLSDEQWKFISNSIQDSKQYSSFEQLAIYSVSNAINQCKDLNLSETILILSTTKGSIANLDEVEDRNTLLHTSSKSIASYFNIKSKPLVISHACVSGVMALVYAQRMLDSGRYKNAIVVGCDCSTQFVLNGFQSFQAIADEQCRPFDANRKGINLGEAAATIVLSTDTINEPLAKMLSGSSSNDANHISGPSRTGEELALSIKRTLDMAGLSAEDIDMVSAHGTATPYNDEMEAKAFGLSGLLDAPLHSFKGYTGHTLGAAGILESAIVLESIKQQALVPSIGYEQLGVSQPVTVTTDMTSKKITNVLKTASGFGGCNASMVWSKV